MREATSPIPYAPVEIDDSPPLRLMRGMPSNLQELARYAQEDDEFLPPHWVRMRLSSDPEVGRVFLETLRRIAPLVDPNDAAAEEAMKTLLPDVRRDGVARFAVDALRHEGPGAVADRLFALAATGRGRDFDHAFERSDAPVSAHLLRLSALRDFGGMPWSEAFETRVGAAIGQLSTEAAAWTVRLVAELHAPQAKAFLAHLTETYAGTAIGNAASRFLADPPTFAPEVDDEDALPTGLEALELLSLDTRKPARRVLALGAMADLDWPRARRLASSIASDEWRLDEAVGALLIYPTRAMMLEDFARRGLIPPEAHHAPMHRTAARELLRAHGRMVRFDTTSPDGLDGVVDHDALAYRLARMAGDCFAGVDFLEELDRGESIALEAWGHGRHYRASLDTSRSIIDPYGLLGLLNAIARDLGRPERFMLAAEDKAVADIAVGPEVELRGLVDAGLMWIRNSFRWT